VQRAIREIAEHTAGMSRGAFEADCKTQEDLPRLRAVVDRISRET